MSEALLRRSSRHGNPQAVKTLATWWRWTSVRARPLSVAFAFAMTLAVFFGLLAGGRDIVNAILAAGAVMAGLGTFAGVQYRFTDEQRLKVRERRTLSTVSGLRPRPSTFAFLPTDDEAYGW